MRVHVILIAAAFLVGSTLGVELKEINAISEPKPPSFTALISRQ